MTRCCSGPGRATTVAILLLLTACGPPAQGPDTPGVETGASGPPGIDADGDGWFTPDDCDDADPAVHPGVVHDKPYDGLDADCAGDDEDVDGDGFLARAVGGDDCDDHDPLIPGDLDGDGFTCEEDCDESDPLVNAGAIPICGDGYDNDCDGVMDCGLHGVQDIDDSADVVIVGNTAGGGLGHSVMISDLSGDGVDDVLVHLSGKPRNYLNLYTGPVAATTMEEDHASLLWTPNMTDYTVGDFDHDGQVDVIATSSYRAEFAQGHVWFGPIAPGEPAPDVRVLEYAHGLPAIYRCDVNHDGGDDLVFGWVNGPTGTGGDAVVELVHGPITQDVPNEDVAARLYSTDFMSSIGAVVRCGDFDADGMDDLVIGGGLLDPLRLVEGPDIPQSTDVEWDAVGSELHTRTALVSHPYDWNGDGYEDLAWSSDGIQVNAGPLTTNSEIATLFPSSSGLLHVTSNGDMDGDGLSDLVALDTNFVDLSPTWTSGKGALLIFLSPLAGTLTTDDAEAIIADDASGTEEMSGGMSTLAPPGDLNHDGYLDLVVGARDRDDVAENAGKVFILYGEQPGF